jgi:hypothetical protein
VVADKAVVQSEEPPPAYEFKTVPGYEHTLGQPGDTAMLFFLNGARA